MVFGKSKVEMSVGIFVFGGLVILMIFVFMVGKFQTWVSRYQVSFIFNFASGVKVGAPVRFAGVDVGEVKEIKFIVLPQSKKHQVDIICWVKKGNIIPVDSTIWVNTLGLLGEKYIEIMPGEDYTNILEENQSLVGKDPIAMHEVAQLAKDLLANMNAAVDKLQTGQGTLGRLFYDDALYKEIEEALRSKQGTIGRLLYDDSLYKEIEDFVLDLKLHPWKLLQKTKEKPVRAR